MGEKLGLLSLKYSFYLNGCGFCYIHKDLKYNSPPNRWGLQSVWVFHVYSIGVYLLCVVCVYNLSSPVIPVLEVMAAPQPTAGMREEQGQASQDGVGEWRGTCHQD